MVIFRDGIQPLTKDFADILVKKETRGNVTICSCKFLENNLCNNPNKPQECINYPSSPFAFLPNDCGYEGDIFIKHEHIKQRHLIITYAINKFTISIVFNRIS